MQAVSGSFRQPLGPVNNKTLVKITGRCYKKKDSFVTLQLELVIRFPSGPDSICSKCTKCKIFNPIMVGGVGDG